MCDECGVRGSMGMGGRAQDGCMRSQGRGGEYVCTELAVHSHEREL